MQEDVAISVENLKKTFRIPHERYSSLKQSAINAFRSKRYTVYEAIQDVSFEIREGEFFSVIGQNGSGKSTLLKILAGIYTPTSGKVRINGSLSPFIELGVGFNPELTARENVFLNGAILGLSRQEVEKQFDDIIAFAELEDFVDQKLKNYSSGMQVRLGFSIAIRAHSKILLVDEVLAVGDANFQQKCFDVFRQLKAEGRTIVFVSHDLGSVQEFSDRVLVLNKGTDYGIFSPSKAVAKYSEINQETINEALLKEPDATEHKSKHDDPVIEKVSLLTSDRKKTRSLMRGQSFLVELDIKNPQEKPLQAGISIVRNDGLYCFGTNTGLDDFNVGKNTHQVARLLFPNQGLQKGSYRIVAGLFSPNLRTVYDMQDEAIHFQISQNDSYEGLTYMEHEWQNERD